MLPVWVTSRFRSYFFINCWVLPCGFSAIGFKMLFVNMLCGWTVYLFLSSLWFEARLLSGLFRADILFLFLSFEFSLLFLDSFLVSYYVKFLALLLLIPRRLRWYPSLFGETPAETLLDLEAVLLCSLMLFFCYNF